MTPSKDYSATFLVDTTPQAAFDAINNVRGWWSGEIEGVTDKLGAEFTYRVLDVHYSRQRIVEFIPGRKVVWEVVDSDLSHAQDRTEWTGTSISFEIAPKTGRNAGKTEVRFTHFGLVEAFECYSACSNAWGSLLHGNLRQLIATGQDQPNLFALKEAATP